ncbi:hypothetical protein KAH94_02615 [bacterium]|nr:hypothetical protein [bacterium]
MKNKLFFLKTILFLFLLIPQQSNTFDGNKVALGLAFVVGAFFSENVSKLCAKKARKQKRLQQKIYLWYQSPKFYKKVSSVSSYFFGH